MHVFFSYSHENTDQLRHLLRALVPVVRGLGLSIWQDGELRPGDSWDNEIASAMDRAAIFVPLVSQAFLSSPYINKQELPRIKRAALERNAFVLPVILEPCFWEDQFGAIQAVPLDRQRRVKPLSKYRSKADAIHAAAEQLRTSLRSALKDPPGMPEPAPGPTLIPTPHGYEIAATVSPELERTDPTNRTLYDRIVEQLSQLASSVERVGNVHANLRSAVIAYTNEFSRGIEVIDVARAWSTGAALHDWINLAADGKDNDVEAQLDSRVALAIRSVLRDHDAFVEGFSQGRTLRVRVARRIQSQVSFQKLRQSASALLERIGEPADLLTPPARSFVSNIHGPLKDQTVSAPALEAGTTLATNAVVALTRSIYPNIVLPRLDQSQAFKSEDNKITLERGTSFLRANVPMISEFLSTTSSSVLERWFAWTIENSHQNAERVPSIELARPVRPMPELSDVEDLLARLRDPKVSIRRLAVRDAALRTQYQDVLEALIVRTSDTSSAVRSAAVAVLSQHADQPRVRRAFVEQLSGIHGSEIDDVVAILGEHAHHSDVESALLNLIHDGASSARHSAIRSLQSRAILPHVRTVLLGCLSDKIPTVRSAAMNALANVAAEPEVSEAAFRFLGDSDYSMQSAVSRLLQQRIREPAIRDRIVGMADSPTTAVREAVAGLLSDGRPDARTIAVLVKLANDPDTDIRRAAVKAIRVVAERPDVCAVLLQNLSHKDYAIRSYAANALAKLSFKPHVWHRLVDLLDNSDDLALKAQLIERLARRTSLPEVYEALEKRIDDADPRIRVAAVRALSDRLSDPSIYIGLIPLLRHENYYVRHSAAIAIGKRIDQSEVLEGVMKLLGERDHRTRAQVIDFLRKHSSNQSVRRLLLAKLSDADVYVQDAAMSALADFRSDPEVRAALRTAGSVTSGSL